MLKSDLIQKLCDSYPNLFRKDLEKAENVFFNEIIDALYRGDRCELRNFGTFKVKIRKSYQARNPKTGQKIMIAEKRVPRFKMSQKIKIKLNDEKG